ncbi:MAG: ribbon-helix-helix protein, CopG family [Syntrophales bacterium]|jgi:predicted transcriptional regulator
MIRTQIQLREEQVIMLKKIAEAQHKSIAEIIRQAVDFFVKAKHGREKQCRRQAMATVGHFRSGVKDLSVSHDSYLTEIFDK